jgi:hypothetical protein
MEMLGIRGYSSKITMITVTRREPTVANILSSKYCTQQGTFLASSTKLRSPLFIENLSGDPPPFLFLSIDQRKSIKSMKKFQISKNLLKKISWHSQTRASHGQLLKGYSSNISHVLLRK